MVADGEGRNMEGERVGLSRWSCCGSAANDLNFGVFFFFKNPANCHTGENIIRISSPIHFKTQTHDQ